MAKIPRLRPPEGGVSDKGTYLDQPTDWTPVGTELNCRPDSTGPAGRKRYGTRPGSEKVFPQQFGTPESREGQGIGVISRASATTSFELGTRTRFSTENADARVSGLVSLNVGVLSQKYHWLRDAILVDGSGGQARAKRGGRPSVDALAAEAASFPNTASPVWVGQHPSGTLGAAAFNYTTGGGQHRTLIVFVDPKRGNVVGSKRIAPAGEDTGSTNNVDALAFTWTAEALWIGRGAALYYVPTPVFGGRSVLLSPLVLDATPAGVDPDRPLTAASRIVALDWYTAGSSTFLWAAFEGATGAGYTETPTGVVTAGTLARHYRSGLYRLEQIPDAAEFSYAFRVRDVPASSPAPGDIYAEVDSTGARVLHNSVRLAAWLDRAPRGALVTAIAADRTDGSVYVAFTNQGWGPTASFAPDGSVAYSTVAKFSASGELMWEADTTSRIGPEQGGKLAGVATKYNTDIPDEDGGNAGTTSHDGPAIRALATDSAGSLYAAGRINSGRASVFAFNTAGGNVRWSRRIESNNTPVPPTAPNPAWVAAGDPGGGVRRFGVCVDSDSQVIVVGRRNNTYGEKNAPDLLPYAMLWKLGSGDGATVWTFSATQDTAETSGLCVCATSVGVVYGCASFTDV